MHIAIGVDWMVPAMCSALSKKHVEESQGKFTPNGSRVDSPLCKYRKMRTSTAKSISNWRLNGFLYALKSPTDQFALSLFFLS